MKTWVKKPVLWTVLALGFFIGLCPRIEARGQSDSVILYTNSASLGRGPWIIEQAKTAGFNVTIVEGGGGDLANRLVAEKNNPQADLVFGINAIQFEQLINEDLLVKFEPAWKDKIDPAMLDSRGLYYPMGVSPVVVFYNTGYYNPTTAPKDIVDLATNPVFKGKYQIHGLGGGTGGAAAVSILMQYLDPKGELGISPQGWDTARQYVQNAYIPQQGEDWFAKLISGELTASTYWLAGLLTDIQNRKADNFEVICPSYGVPFPIEGIAMINNGKKNQERVKAFIDWFGTADIQNQWAANFGHIPTNKDVRLPELTQRFMGKLKPMNIDWVLAAKNIQAWVEKIQLEYVP